MNLFSKNLVKYLWIYIFQTLNLFFCYLGVFTQNVPFIKTNSFGESFFWSPILTCVNTPNRFFGFFLICKIFVLNICVYLGFGELRQLCAKFGKFWAEIHREMICQSWLLWSPFFYFPIVHWWVSELVTEWLNNIL